MGGLGHSRSEPTLPNRSLLQGGYSVLNRHADFETQRKVLQHYRRLDAIKPSVVHREQQERDYKKHRRLVQLRQRFPVQPVQGQQDLRQNQSRRGFERKLEQMLLKDWDGADREFAWQQHAKTRKTSLVEVHATSVGELASGPEAADMNPEGAGDLQPKTEEDEGTTPLSREPPADASPAPVGNAAVGMSLADNHMKPPDFRSILQDGPPSAAPANGAVGSSAPAFGNAVGIDASASGAAAHGGQVQAPDFRSNLHADANFSPGGVGPMAGGPLGSGLPQGNLAANPLGNEPATGLGPNLGGGLGGGRRMQPPDFRSILQDDPPSAAPANGAVGSSAPAFGNAVGGHQSPTILEPSVIGNPLQSGESVPNAAVDPYGFSEVQSGYVPSAASAPRRRRPRAGQL